MTARPCRSALPSTKQSPPPGSPAIFAFLVSWNEFLFALILSGVEAKTLPVVIAGLNTDAGPLYGEMSAAAVMVMLPNIVMTLALQRYLVKGLTLGAVKG